MSFTTWTPTEVASKARLVPRLQLWRAVEAQHQVSTTLLVDNLSEQALLERLLEGSKPTVPRQPAGLHWLLFTPFRYPALPGGSRFRAAADPGVFYGAEAIRTACAELGYWRWRFLLDSPSLDRIDSRPQTVFLSSVAGMAIDLREEPWAAAHVQWTAPNDYDPCQAFARTARQAEVALIRYESVRDPLHGGCTAVLHTDAFRHKEPLEAHTWLLTVTTQRVFWRKDAVLEDAAFEFNYARRSKSRSN